MNLRELGIVAGIVYALTAGGCILGVAGCAGPDGQQKFDQATYLLQQGKARGALQLSVSEHPAQVGQSTHFFAGPNAELAFNGDVDFGAGVTGNVVVGETKTTEIKTAPAPK